MPPRDPADDPATPSTDDPELAEMLNQLDKAQAADEVVERARESLEATLSSLKLTPEEEHALADELRQLRELGQKLDDNTIDIAAFGMVSRGKSAALNALLGHEVSTIGTTHGTTVSRASQRWEHSATPQHPRLEGA